MNGRNVVHSNIIPLNHKQLIQCDLSHMFEHHDPTPEGVASSRQGCKPL